MAQNWDYAELSKAAKKAGGPEKYVEMLARANRYAGKVEMFPWMVVTAIGASIFTVAAVKISDYLGSRKRQNQKEFEEVKRELIEGIKAYDAEHENLEENQSVE